METAFGLDVGGTHARVGLVDDAGRVLAFRRERTPRDGDGSRLLDWLVRTCEALMSDRPPAAGRPACVGCALPGVLDAGRTVVVRAVNLDFLQGRHIRDELAARLKLPVVLESDSAAAAWGEYTACHNPRARFVYLTIGTGVGATVIVDGAILRHTRNSAGQIGHLILDARTDAPACRCGARGCLEALVCGPALERAAAAHHLTDSLNELEVACREGNAEALRIVSTAARFLGAALVSLAHLFAPDVLVLGGGVVTALPSLLIGARQALQEKSGDLVSRTLDVCAGRIGEQAGVIGAAQLARRHFGLDAASS